jgi:hypothetical protein
MLLGRFEEGRVTSTNPELGSVRPDEATVNLRPFDLGQARLFECSGHACYGCRSQGGISHRRVGGGGFRSARTGGVRGGFTLRDGELRFEPRRLEVLGAPVPRRFTQALLRGASFAYPVGLPFGEVSGVDMREGRLVLAGEVEDLPIG